MNSDKRHVLSKKLIPEEVILTIHAASQYIKEYAWRFTFSEVFASRDHRKKQILGELRGTAARNGAIFSTVRDSQFFFGCQEWNTIFSLFVTRGL
jgi:hypothetical protein